MDAKYDQTICDGRLISKKAVEYLIALGHQKIAHIERQTMSSAIWVIATRCGRHGMPICDEYIADVSCQPKMDTAARRRS